MKTMTNHICSEDSRKETIDSLIKGNNSKIGEICNIVAYSYARMHNSL